MPTYDRQTAIAGCKIKKQHHAIAGKLWQVCMLMIRGLQPAIMSRKIRAWGLPVYLICCASLCYGQSHGENYSRDTAEVKRIFACALAHSNTDSAISLYRLAINKARDAGYETAVTNSLINLAAVYSRTGDYVSELSCLEAALNTKTTPLQRAKIYSNTGALYMATGDNEMALKQFLLALIERGNLPASAEGSWAITYVNMAQVCADNRQYDRMDEYLREAENIARKTHFSLGLTMVLTTKSRLLSILQKPDSARACLEEALILAKTNNYDQQAWMIYCEIGTLLTDEAQYTEAIRYFSKAVAASKDKDAYTFLESSERMAQALYLSGDNRKAEEILTMVLDKSGKNEARAIKLGAWRLLRQVHHAQGKYAAAYADADSLMLLQDTVWNAEKAKAIAMMEMRYKSAEQEKKILTQQALMARQNTWIISIVSAILLAAVILAALYSRAASRQRLQAENLKAIAQDAKIAILKAAVQGGDNERTRIARELHDGIGGMLSAAIMRLSSVRPEGNGENAPLAYRDSLNILKEIGDEIRKTAHNLMPEALLRQNLPEAAREYCNQVAQGAQLSLSFQYYGAFGPMPENYRLNIYRIIQELIKNIIQHANATTALIQLTATEHTITITAEDDGTGFDTDSPRSGMGLTNMETRVKSMDGTLTLTSQKDKGTSVFIELPFIKGVS